MIERNFLIFEDNDMSRTLFEKVIEVAGGKVIETATHIDEAREKVERLEPGEANFALVDGDLGSGRKPGEDGNEIAGLLRQKFGGEIAIIGVSGSRDDIAHADTNLYKPMNLDEFVGFVQEIAPTQLDS
jgi:CheY-like chemotaxis protein